MVSTRNHPSNFSDTKSSTPTSSSSSPVPTARSISAELKPRSKANLSPKQKSETRGSKEASLQGGHSKRNLPNGKWSHTPSNLTLIWLAISLPLVFWDIGYVSLRPYSMPGGPLHSPIWSPYALYGKVDYIYGFPAWEAHNGFTAAQTFLNFVECAGYILYLVIVGRYGDEGSRVDSGRGAPAKKYLGWLGEGRVLGGRWARWAVLVGFAMSVTTFSKTVLYWLNEYFGEFDNIGHNDAFTLIFLWIIPNGAWLAFPGYMIYVFGQEILEGLAFATGEYEEGAVKPTSQALATKDQ